jgi:7-cyano-7-deazaguanine synthase in queuosine biosynthesis
MFGCVSQSYKELEKPEQVNEKLTVENRVLKLDIYNVKTIDKQLARKDGQIDEDNKIGNPY